MSLEYQKGSTNISVDIRIVDDTSGQPETGVVFNTSGIDLKFRREGAAVVVITEIDLTSPALTDAHEDGGFLHIGDGYYRLDVPDAAFATGANGVLIFGTVTGMVVIGEYVQLVDYDPFDAVRLGLTELPNAAADAAGGLPISDLGGLDMDLIHPAPLTKGTADSGSATTLVDSALTQVNDDHWAGSWLRFTSGANAGAVRLIVAFTASLDRLVFQPPVLTAVNTETYEIIPASAVDIREWQGESVNTLVSGAVDVNVSALQPDVITVQSIAADAIGSQELATSAINEIRDALRTDAVTSLISDAGPAAGDFDGDSGLSASNDFYNGSVLVFTGGALAGIARRISDYVGASRNIQFNGTGSDADAPFPTAPANTDPFLIVGRIGA